MKTNYILWLILSLMLVTTCRLHAQEDRNRGIIQSALYGLEYEVKAGFNIGGASPIPLPKEIRALTGYSPNINFSIEGDIINGLDVLSFLEKLLLRRIVLLKILYFSKMFHLQPPRQHRASILHHGHPS